jgi:hypothetical protein
MGRALAVSLTLLLIALVAVGEDSTPTSTPELQIVTRLGVKEEVKVFNSEPMMFFARAAGGDGALLRGVRFVLFDEGGVADRKEFVRAETEDEVRWGRPPSSLALPLGDRPLPIGRYRLRAAKRGHIADEIKIIYARFHYFDLVVEHDEAHYAAKFHLRLEDRTEVRPIVPVEVEVVTSDGLLVDAQSLKLRRVAGVDIVLETVDPIRISSRVPAHRTRIEERRPVVLKIVPGAILVLVLDGLRFEHPIPLAPTVIKSREREQPEDFGDRRGSRFGSRPPRDR